MRRWNWLFVPGGPGLGSESLLGLARAARVSGSIWLVDLPGDGSNRALPVLGVDPYARWPDVLAEAAEALEGVVMVGHSTGGMFILSVPELEAHLSGMALVSSLPTGAGERFLLNMPESIRSPKSTEQLSATPNIRATSTCAR